LVPNDKHCAQVTTNLYAKITTTKTKSSHIAINGTDHPTKLNEAIRSEDGAQGSICIFGTTDLVSSRAIDELAE
jgi:hypothetical protein